MAMTLDTSEGCSMPYLPGCVHPVDDGGDSKFLIVRSTFVVVHRIPMESCSDQLFITRESAGSFQYITGYWFDGKLIERLVFLEVTDDVISKFPNDPGTISFVPFRVGVARQIHPHCRPSLTQGR